MSSLPVPDEAFADPWGERRDGTTVRSPLSGQLSIRCRRHPGVAPGDSEAVFLEDPRQEFRGLDLLHAEFAKRVHLIDHHLCQLGSGIDRQSGDRQLGMTSETMACDLQV
jgi:hypothetical protein